MTGIITLLLVSLVFINAKATPTTLNVTIRYETDNNVNITSDSPNMFLRGVGFEEISWDESIQCSRVDENTWTTMLTYDNNMRTNTPQLKVLIGDSMWQLGSNIIVNSSSTTLTIYPWFENKEGTVTYLSQSVKSKELNNTRPVVLYVPPSYSENKISVVRNILIMQDGNNLFDEIASTCGTCCPLGCWGIGDTLDETIVSGVVEEILVVGVFNTPQRLSEYTYSQDTSVSTDPPLADQYLDFIESTVIPLVKENIRIAENARFGLLGSSLGGLLSCYGGWTRPHIYDAAGCMSSSFWWNNEDFNRVILHNGTSSSSSGNSDNIFTTFYLDSGTGIPPQSDDDEFETIRVESSMVSLGKKKNKTLFYYLDDGGQHSEMSWGRRFWIPISRLFPGSNNASMFFFKTD